MGNLLHCGVPSALSTPSVASFSTLAAACGQMTTARLFDIETGVRYGCVMSLFLFMLVIDFIMCRSADQLGVGVHWCKAPRLADMDFTDDIDLMVDPKRAPSVDSNNAVAAKVEMKVSSTFILTSFTSCLVIETLLDDRTLFKAN